MILPNGKNKKYAEVVSGLYILYVILNPILNIENSLAFSNIQSRIETMSQESLLSQEEVARTYILGLENALKDKIESLGYEVAYIQFYITQDYSSIAKIDVKMKTGLEYDVDHIQGIVLEEFPVGKENIKIF